MTVRPEHTYAVAIGVDKYDLPGTAWELAAARRDAIAFSEWLCEQKVPAKNISLVMSGTKQDLPGRLSECRLEWPRADMIKALLANDLGGKKGDLLVVYWSGHGELSGHEDRLLLSNTTNQCRATIRTQDLRNALASKPFQEYSRKVLIVDACRAPGGPAAEPERFDLGGFVKPPVALVQSAAKGDKAKAGDFGQRFLSRLKSAEWPPDFEAIGRELAAEVEPGEAQPIPQHSPAPLPDNLALFCDRTDASSEFRSLMRTAFNQSSRPVLCLIHAEKHHMPDSLVDRLIEEVKLHKGTGSHPHVVDWNDRDANKTRSILSEELLKDAGLIPPAEFARRIPETKTKPFVMIRHNITRWSETSRDTLAAYLDFWREWPALTPSQARVFVFFSIPCAVRWDWRRFRHGPDPRVVAALAGLAPPEPALILTNLQLVSRQDLTDLFTRYRPQWTGTERERRIVAILGNRDGEPMNIVEEKLTKIFQEKGNS